MNFAVNKKYLQMNAEQIALRAGFGHIHDSRSGKDSYVRRLTEHYYPRLHLYIKDEGDRFIFDLHLDQKQTSYQGSHMHNAEYDGEIVEGEIARLKQFIMSLSASQATTPAKPPQEEEKRPWYKLW